MNPRRIRTGRLPALLLIGLVACGDAGGNAEPAFTEDTAAADPVTEDRPATRGLPANADTSKPPGTIGDPEAGTPVVATLTEWGIALSEDSIPVGQVLITVRNEGTVPHALELTGQHAGRWRSLPLRPGGEVQMSMVLSDGTYQAYCPLDDEAGDHSERGQETTLVVF